MVKLSEITRLLQSRDSSKLFHCTGRTWSSIYCQVQEHDSSVQHTQYPLGIEENSILRLSFADGLYIFILQTALGMLEVLNQDQMREKHPSAQPHRCGNAQIHNVKHQNWLEKEKKKKKKSSYIII